MAKQPNFLLGNGHRLTSPVRVSRVPGEKTPPYKFEEARARLTTQFTSAVADFKQLPQLACPDGYAVGIITLHPEYTAKSYFPDELLKEARMEAIGSRPSRVTPDKWGKKAKPEESPTTELFVAARRSDFADLAKDLPNWADTHRGAGELFEVEAFRAPRREDRVQKISKRHDSPLLEVVLHTSGIPRPGHILEAFEAFADSLDLEPDLDRRFEVGGLCFLPLRAPRSQITDLSKFSFLRTIREMPGLRPLRPLIRSTAKFRPFPVSLPETQPLDPQLRAAVFDGGLTEDADFAPFANAHEPDGIGTAVPHYVEHGTAVTSAVLFGALTKDTELPRPYGVVDHYRVLDEQTGTGDDGSGNSHFELYDALARIRDVLQTRKYSFVNLSIGPALPIEDHEVHAWTAVLDSLLSDGETLTTVAEGNDGEKDHESGNARVQVPSDSVNSLAVGAANSRGSNWTRAAYSCIGPGRSPGVIKPEVLNFGGSEKEPFFVLDPTLSFATPDAGTSYASPATLRMGMGVRAHFGTDLSALAIKALLVHGSEPAENLAIHEVGWGRVPQDLEALVVCKDGEARIVYQGELTPAQYLRTPVPMPSGKLAGMVTLKATFCFACDTDPHDPSNYTRGGLDITFRPHSEKVDDDANHPKSKSFFRQTDYDTEKELRRDAHKWETTLHRSHKFRASTLKDPVFDVHYQVRESGRATSGEKIRYALVLTISAPKVKHLYDSIVQRYRTQLEPILPLIEIPVPIR